MNNNDDEFDLLNDETNKSDLMFCSKCGYENYANNNFCKNCGSKLYVDEKKVKYTINSFKEKMDNTYSNFTKLDYDDLTVANWDNKHMLNFIQKNIEYYIPKFKNIQDSNKSISWNWSAFWLGGYWFMYRKMYLTGVLVLILSSLLSLIPFIGPFLTLALPFLNGCFANIIYLKHICKKLNEINIIPNKEIQLMLILKNGGVNLAIPLILCIFLPLSIYLIAFLFFFFSSMMAFPYYY